MHKKLLTTWIIAGSLMSLSHATLADSAVGAKNRIWQGDSELGFVITGGNTDTQTVNGKLDLTNDRTKWRHNFHLEALNTSEGDNTSAEKYLGSVKSDYKFSSEDFIFASLTYEDDRFNASGYDYQITAALGYGRTLISNDLQSLSVEAGPGYRYSTIKATSDSENEGIVRTAAKYRLQLSETSEFQQDVLLDFGEEETISKSLTALKAQIVGELAMKISLALRHTNEALPGNDSLDTETGLTLVYSF